MYWNWVRRICYFDLLYSKFSASFIPSQAPITVIIVVIVDDYLVPVRIILSGSV